jgi:hypothetical protein
MRSTSIDKGKRQKREKEVKRTICVPHSMSMIDFDHQNNKYQVNDESHLSYHNDIFDEQIFLLLFS